MLYELLTGSPPLDTRGLQRGGCHPGDAADGARGRSAWPSTKLSTAEALPNIAANRSIEPARLAKLLRGELDWVVMKALEKDRNRRYDSANGLARDIQRYLADEVVEARPLSCAFIGSLFVRRNLLQLPALAGTAVLPCWAAGRSPGGRIDKRPSGGRRARNREQQANQVVDAALKLVPDLRKQYKPGGGEEDAGAGGCSGLAGRAPDRLAEVEQASRTSGSSTSTHPLSRGSTEGTERATSMRKSPACLPPGVSAERDLNLTTSTWPRRPGESRHPR